LNRQDEAIRDIEAKLGLLEYATTKEIESQVILKSQDAYCKQVQTQGTNENLNIYKVFNECSAYFQSNPPAASQPVAPTASQPVVLEQLGGPISSGPTGAEEVSGAQEGGGYREDISGVMQFGGDLTVSAAVLPSEDNDISYLDGYRVGYRQAYLQTYSLTLAIKITQKASQKKITTSQPTIDYGAAVETIINASMPITEAAAIKSSKSIKSKASGPKSMPPTEAIANASTNATGAVTEGEARSSANTTGPTQGGGFLKIAQRKFQRGRTLTQHAHLLKRIADRTTAA
jgi:hypothetical protein